MKTSQSRLIFGLCLAPCLLWPVSGRAQSQNELTQQAARHFEAADARLNRVYRQLIGKLDQTSVAKLRRTERAWVMFRDADADCEADRLARGGSMYAMIYYGVRADLTQTRTRELETVLKDAENQ